MTPLFPFTAIVGHEALKKALLLVAIDHRLGGVLISGPRGSAKSTVARSLAELLGHPIFVNLPLGASEEKLVGTLNLEKALAQNSVEFSPGLLARAHEGILYVDEINLLPDHLVDLLLDVAASGRNHIERDGISHDHAADFVLIGTMNPDEGELRPQLLDRFGLMVDIHEQFSIEERRDVVRTRLAFDQHPHDFCAQYEPQQTQLKNTLIKAREQLLHISVSSEIEDQIAQRCHAAHVEGFRADITWYRAARAHAALMQRTNVTDEDIDAVAAFVLNHRTNHNQPPQSQSQSSTKSSPSSTAGKSGSSIQGSWGEMEGQAVLTGTSRHLSEIDLKKDVKKKS